MSKIVDYEIIKQINAGGMADIYLGLIYSDTGFQRLCAIKKLQPQYRGNARAEELFREEAQIGQILQHTNIVRVIDFDKIGDSDALIMEFIHGTDALKLFQICKKMQMKISVGMAAYIGSELARALHYAHMAKDPSTGKFLGLVHCDVSPANILISYEGEVKLTDFGVAKSDIQVEELVAYAMKGKVRYMSPEYMHSGVADPRLDIYSLGVILWELLSGRELFKGSTSDEVSRLKLESVDKMQLSDFNDSVDPKLEEIIKKCLHYDPVKRYKSARELELELTQYFHLRDPGFTPMKLGLFLQSIRANEYKSMQELIRESLNKKHLPVKETGSMPPRSLQTYFAQTQDTLIIPDSIVESVAKLEERTKENRLKEERTKENRIKEESTKENKALQEQPIKHEQTKENSPPEVVVIQVPLVTKPQVLPQPVVHPVAQAVQTQQQKPKIDLDREPEDDMEFDDVVYHEPVYKSAIKHEPMEVDEWRQDGLIRVIFWLLFMTAFMTGTYILATSRSPKAEQIRKELNNVINRIVR